MKSGPYMFGACWGPTMTSSATKRLAVSLKSKVGTLTLHPQASASTGGPQVSCQVSVSTSVVLDQKAVLIASSRGIAYHKGPDINVVVDGVPVTLNYRESNKVDDVENVVGDSVVNYWSFRNDADQLDEGYECRPRFSRQLWGAWTNPYNTWKADPEHWEDTLFSEIEDVTPNWQFSESEMESMIANGPVTKTCSVTVTDNGNMGVARSSTYTMRIHAPIEAVRQDEHRLVHGQEKLIWGPNLTDISNVQTAFSLSIASSNTKTVSVGLNIEGFDLLKKVLKPSFGASYGETATISKTTTVSIGLPVGLKVYIVGAPQWIEWDVSWDAYDVNGFVGTMGATALKWVSDDKNAAENNINGGDYVWHVKTGEPTADEL